MEPTYFGLGAAGVGVALVLSLVAVLVLRKARRARAVEESASETALDPVVEVPEAAEAPEVPEEEPAEALLALVGDRESVLVRALRAQVRTLEQALEQAPVDRIPALEPAQVPAEQEPAAAYRRQVTLTLRALAGRTDHVESPQRTLARVAAAIERLDAPDGLARPAIPAPVVRVAQPTAPELPEAPVRALTSVAPVVEPVVEPAAPAASVVEAPVETEAMVAAALTVEPVATERELVLPVPPPAPAEPKRTKRRLRRNAA